MLAIYTRQHWAVTQLMQTVGGFGSSSLCFPVQCAVGAPLSSAAVGAWPNRHQKSHALVLVRRGRGPRVSRLFRGRGSRIGATPVAGAAGTADAACPAGRAVSTDAAAVIRG